MPGLNGIEATRVVRERFPNVGVLMLTMADGEHWVRESLEVGAQGYLLKSAGRKELLHAIRAIAEGGEYFGTDLKKMLLGKLQTSPPAPATPVHETREAAGKQFLADISAKELEVLRLFAKGYTNAQIGEMLFISRRTIESHRQHLLEKTGSINTTTLIRYAIEQGLLEGLL